MLVSLCAETIKPVFKGDKIWQLWKKNASAYQVYPVSRDNRWGEDGVFKGMGRWDWTRGSRGGGGGERATQSERGNYKPSKRNTSDGWLWKGCISSSCISCKSYNQCGEGTCSKGWDGVLRTSSGKMGFTTAWGRVVVGVGDTRGARYRRWCRWWGRRGSWGGGGVIGTTAMIGRKIMRWYHLRGSVYFSRFRL